MIFSHSYPEEILRHDLPSFLCQSFFNPPFTGEGMEGGSILRSLSLRFLLHVSLGHISHSPPDSELMCVCCACSATAVVSDSLWLYGLWPTRLLCPWDSPGKNTGVGCHASSRGSSWTRDWTRVSCISCITSRLFSWAIGEALWNWYPLRTSITVAKCGAHGLPHHFFHICDTFYTGLQIALKSDATYGGDHDL